MGSASKGVEGNLSAAKQKCPVATTAFSVSQQTTGKKLLRIQTEWAQPPDCRHMCSRAPLKHLIGLTIVGGKYLHTSTAFTE